VPPFFPNLAFAWTFYGLLVALLAIAAVIDLRQLIVPKWLSLTTLAVGVACNVVRGGWLGVLGFETWKLGSHGIGIGLADGFLFSLAGFSTGFGIFFLMWMVGACAGGDVKLFAAVSSWVGPYISLWILVLSTLILIVLLGFKVVALFLFQSPKAQPPPQSDKKGKAPMPGKPRNGRGMTYSLPVALATALALLWFFRGDLQLMTPRNFGPAETSNIK